MDYLMLIKIFFLVVAQNASFTLVSRARNSDSVVFHGVSAVLSNGIWLLVMKNVVNNFDNIPFLIVYVIASVTGSLLMHYYSMKFIEKLFNKK